MNWRESFKFLNDPLFKLGTMEITLATLLQVIAVVVLVTLLATLTRRLLQSRLLSRSKLDLGLQYAIARIVSYGVLALGLLVGLSAIGIDLTSLTVLLGALGIGIGFGLQTTVNNFVSGLILLTERSIQVGDRVEVGTTSGRVTRIGARATSIETNDNITIIVPNSEFVSGRVINWSHAGDGRMRFRITVSVSYSCDAQLVEKLLMEVAAANETVLKEPPPTVAFREFGDNALVFELRVWTATMTHRPGMLRSQINFAIWDKFKQHGIRIPYPQRDLHLSEPVRVELTRPTGSALP